jgi:hypothetical protein
MRDVRRQNGAARLRRRPLADHFHEPLVVGAVDDRGAVLVRRNDRLDEGVLAMFLNFYA